MQQHRHMVRQWIDSLGEDGESRVLECVRPLVREYVREPLRNGTAGAAAYERRLAAVLEYHWWRHNQYAFRPLPEVLDLVRAGRLAYGTFQADVLREVLLAERVVQQDHRACNEFLEEYSPVIAAAIRQAGGIQAEQELEDLEAEFLVAARDRPARLSQFKGWTPLALWLRQVVKNRWLSYLRAKGHQQNHQTAPDGGGGTRPEQFVEEKERVGMLTPLFDLAVSELEPQEVSLLRMSLLEGVSNVQLARRRRVHPSTITRHRQLAVRKLTGRFEELVSRFSADSGYASCGEWLTTASRETLLALAEHLAERVRRG